MDDFNVSPDLYEQAAATNCLMDFNDWTGELQKSAVNYLNRWQEYQADTPKWRLLRRWRCAHEIRRQKRWCIKVAQLHAEGLKVRMHIRTRSKGGSLAEIRELKRKVWQLGLLEYRQSLEHAIDFLEGTYPDDEPPEAA